jgi:hypothetical protein
MIRRFITVMAAATLSYALATLAIAAPNPSGTGQPNQECEDVHPGQSASAPGSAFNETGKAGTVYANPDSTGGLASGGNSHVRSQYDTACYQQSVRPSGASAHASGHKP